MEKIFNKKAKGITLIALVITIVIVLILAGISMSFVLGENGIITKAQEAREKTEEAKANEEKDFAGWTDSTDKILNDNQNDDDDDYDNGMAKYFIYSVDEDTNEATITGVDREYMEYEYYNRDQSSGARVKAIIDEGKRITDIVIPREIEHNGKKYIVTKIGEDILSIGGLGSDSVKGGITGLIMPDTITEIGNKAFYRQPIENIIFSSNLRKIGSSAFYNNKLTSIQIPRSLVSIESEAFDAYYRDTITIVKIPKNVVTIGSYAFYNAEVYCEATEKPEGWDYSWAHSCKSIKWGQTM